MTIRIATLVFALMAATSLTLADAPKENTSNPRFATWLRGSGEDLEIRLHGKIVDEQGETVPSPRVGFEFLPNNDQAIIQGSVDNGQFKVWLPVNRIPYYYGLQVNVHDPKSGKRWQRFIGKEHLREHAIKGIPLTVTAPFRTVAICVGDESQAVADANLNVRIAKDDFSSRIHSSKTNEAGVAEVTLYDGENVASVVAWTSDKRVGGFTVFRKPKRDPNADSYECELHPSRSQTIRLIDQQGKPVPETRIRVSVGTPRPNYNHFGEFSDRTHTTDDNGEATFDWFPDWDVVYCFVDVLDSGWVKQGQVTWQDGIATQVLKPDVNRRRATGTVKQDGAPVAGVLVECQSFEHPQANRIDARTAFTNASGEFQLDLLPGATYATFVRDNRLVSRITDRIPLPSESSDEQVPNEDAKTHSIDLEVVPGTKVTVVATTGDQAAPNDGATVSFYSTHHLKWLENGKERSGDLGRSISTKTDQFGQATTFVPSGKLEVSIHESSWSESKKLEVLDGQSALLAFHRPFKEGRIVKGILVAAEQLDVDLTNAKVRSGAIDGLSDETFDSVAASDGSFEFKTAATRFGVYVETVDKNAAGVAFADQASELLRVTLLPTMTFQGQLLNKKGKPIPNHKVSASINVEGEKVYDQSYLASFRVGEMEAVTNEDGIYTFEKVPAQLPIKFVTYAPHDASDRETLHTVYLTPGEERPLTIDRIDDGTGSAPKAAPIGLEDRFAKVLRDCRLGGYHLMMISHGNTPAANEFVGKHLNNPSHQKAIARYMPLMVKLNDPIAMDDTAFAKAMRWPTVGDDEVFVAIYDQAGELLESTRFNVDDEDAPPRCDAFVKRLAPAQVDAEKKWQDAFSIAQKTDRRVWAVNGGRYCGPCIRLSRWIDDHRGVLEKDFVFYKVDGFLDEKAKQVIQRITEGGAYGVPFYAIFDAKGKPLADSKSPIGNIGMPSSYEGQQQMKKILNAAHIRLSENEIKTLVESLGSI